MINSVVAYVAIQPHQVDKVVGSNGLAGLASCSNNPVGAVLDGVGRSSSGWINSVSLDESQAGQLEQTERNCRSHLGKIY